MSLKYLRTSLRTASGNSPKNQSWRRQINNAKQNQLDELIQERQRLERARHAADAPIDKLLKDKADQASRRISILQDQLKEDS